MGTPGPGTQPYQAAPTIERREGRRSLRYYCSLGSQTPRTMRNDCRRAGYW